MGLRSMANRITAFMVIPAVFIAGGLALYGVERVPGETVAASRSTAPAATPATEPLPLTDGQELPPDHPPIGAAASPHGMRAGVQAGSGMQPTSGVEPAALAWTMPVTWQEAPNSNAMRLATYHAPGGVEVTVSRAGGETEANIQRWVDQFDNVGHEGRAEKTVRGLHVVTVDIAGTYVGGGMSMGGPAEPKADWAMVGAIVESRTPPYFFKMTGPRAAVHAARAVFDHVLDGIAPT